LDVDGTILIESMAIAEYLEEKYPDIRLLPTDVLVKA
jgi:glutathione S-transferase